MRLLSGEECKDDESPENCNFWKGEGYCEDEKFKDSMLAVCPKTCGACAEQGNVLSIYPELYVSITLFLEH